MIRYLLDDPVYLSAYEDRLAEAIATDGAFDEVWVKARVAAYHDLIGEYVVGPTEHESTDYTFLRNDAEFTSSTAELQQHAETRAALVRSVLGL